MSMQSFPENSYHQLLDQVRRSLREQGVVEQMIDLLTTASEKVMNNEAIVLSRPEKRRLIQDSMKAIMEDVLERIEGGGHA